MGDNVNVSPSGSVPIATDDVAGVQFQKVKVNLGSDGLDGGLVSGDNPLPTSDKSIADLYNMLGFFLDRLEYGMLTDNAKRLRVVVDNTVAVGSIGTITTLTTLTTAGTLTNQSRIGDVQAQRVVEAQMDVAFNIGLINRITF